MQKTRVSLGRLTRSVEKYIVFRSVTATPAAAKSKVNKSGSLLKIGLDVAGEICHVGSHQHGRCKLMVRKVHQFDPY